jgi:hypothetical protein
MPLSDPEAFLRKHYIHEVNMLRQVFRHHKVANNQIVKNALYDSFCVHARALWDFFSSVSAKGDDVIAQHFASNWNPGNSIVSQLPSSQRDAINKQVAHLTDKRENAVPIDDAQMQSIHDALVNDDANFQNQVDLRYRSCFDEEIQASTSVHIPSQPGQANVAIYASSVIQ